MAITQEKDPRTNKPFLMAAGEVRAIYFNEIKPEHRKDYGKDGKSWIPTHRIVIQIDDDKIQAGMKDFPEDKTPELRVKDAENDKVYHTVAKGAKLSVVVKKGEPYKGVDQYTCFTSDIIVTEPAPEVASSGGKASGEPRQKADPVELIAGNARNAAAIMVKRFGVDFDQGISYAAQVAHNAKIEYAESSGLGAFQVGVSVGEAIKVAAELAESLEAIPDYITAYLANQVPHSLEVVKGMAGNKEFVTPELPSTESKPKATKPRAAPKATKPKDEPKEEPAPMDDDIPFN